MDKWKQLEEKLQGVSSGADVLADGYTVNLRKRLYKERLVIEVGVEGEVKREWWEVDADRKPKHPEGRFWRPVKTRAYSLKDYKKIKSAFGKRKADQMTALKVVALMPWWNSPRTLIAHLKREFPDLELTEESAQ
ncbi:hypothetical protein E4656_13655 [Natronospirillum operosum]|uniref:Uncharacterized protein n=1 Tax=Natronospirillum operosum TaxID=2759953 RepID=A0A4Z0W7E5_9GAMM|nr:hypothetical protein [Natronospirillum operosum]TGG92512.1 hypothetical protein E4656_13655 [Natronospirillum operosum]